MKQALLLVAHGSRRDAANDEIIALTSRLRSMAGKEFSAVTHAFLEFVEPSIPAGIETLIGDGAECVVVLPYFLASGNHIVQDIPAQVAAKQAEHPDVDIQIRPYLGRSEAIPKLLLSLARLHFLQSDDREFQADCAPRRSTL